MKHKEIIAGLHTKLKEFVIYTSTSDLAKIINKIDRLFKEYHQLLNVEKMEVTRITLKQRDTERKYEEWLCWLMIEDEEVFDRDEYSQGWDDGHKAEQGSGEE